MLVMKFGGTSLASAERFSRAVALASRCEGRGVLVVVSAVAGTTDGLIEASQAAQKAELTRAREILDRLEDEHRRILVELDEAGAATEEVGRVFRELADVLQGVSFLRELTPRVRDLVVGQGELLSAMLFTAAGRAAAVEIAFADARELLVTDGRFGAARPDREATTARAREKLLPLLERGIAVTQGFVGATPKGEPTTLGRGGSDFSASLLGAALGVEEIQIWTDVPGMLTADHRVVPEGLPIRELSFHEAAELAYFGAKVLHPATIEPALARDIPVRILDSARPEEPGTRITAHPKTSGPPVKSIATKRGIIIVYVRSLRMLMAHGFLRAIFEVFDELEMPIDLVATSEVSVSLTLDDDRGLEQAVAALSKFAEVRVERERGIVCLVGEGLSRSPGLAARALSVLGEIQVEMVSQGASEINLSMVVAGKDVEEAVRRLHEEFFGSFVRPARAASEASAAFDSARATSKLRRSSKGEGGRAKPRRSPKGEGGSTARPASE